jgi:hypothetical protein
MMVVTTSSTPVSRLAFGQARNFRARIEAASIIASEQMKSLADGARAASKRRQGSMAVLWGAILALPPHKLPHGGIGRFNSPGNQRVLFYSLEEDRTEQRRRFRATMDQFGASAADFDGRLVSNGCDDVGTLLAYDTSSGKLTNIELYDLLREQINAHRPDVLVLDPIVENAHCTRERQHCAPSGHGDAALPGP